MDLCIVKALLIIVKYCASCDNCSECPIHDFCGKMPLEW